MVRDINASFNLNPKDSNYANDLVTLAKHAEAAERCVCACVCVTS
jgi:hypothetical protein